MLAVASARPWRGTSSAPAQSSSCFSIIPSKICTKSTRNCARAVRLRTLPFLATSRDEGLLDEVFEKNGPGVIFHAAAFKHVPLMEANPIAVVRNNVLGTRTLANAALRYGVRQLIMISTDKAVNPRSVMGAAKRVAELILLRFSNSATRMSAVRLGNVLGSNGSVVPLFQQQIARGGPVTVTHPDSRRYFISLAETVELIHAAAALNEDAGVLVPELGAPVNILDLANRLIREAGCRSRSN